MKTTRYVTLAVVMTALIAGAGLQQGRCDDAAKATWKSIFNGKDLDGWKGVGNAVWKVEDGCLVGTQTDGRGGDLFTTDQWDNFELRFTYKVAWPANTGVWYRANSESVAGYQFDILKYANPLTYSGALYFTGCKTTFLFRNLDEKIENRDGWNEGQVFASGDHFIQWLNGRKIGEGNDKTFTKGKVGIQVHPGDGFKNMKITIQKIEIRPLAAGEGPTVPPAPPAPAEK